jgi:hypothetical protein
MRRTWTWEMPSADPFFRRSYAERPIGTPNFDVARKPPDISGAQAGNSFAKISKNLLTSTA